MYWGSVSADRRRTRHVPSCRGILSLPWLWKICWGGFFGGKFTCSQKLAVGLRRFGGLYVVAGLFYCYYLLHWVVFAFLIFGNGSLRTRRLKFHFLIISVLWLSRRISQYLWSLILLAHITRVLICTDVIRWTITKSRFMSIRRRFLRWKGTRWTSLNPNYSTPWKARSDETLFIPAIPKTPVFLFHRLICCFLLWKVLRMYQQRLQAVTRKLCFRHSVVYGFCESSTVSERVWGPQFFA